MVRVLGIDPGSAATGWADISISGNRYTLHDWGVIRPRGPNRPARLADLRSKLEDILLRTNAEEAAVETTFSGRNPKSAIALAEARGTILSVLGGGTLEVAGYSPAEVKKSIVGNGRAEKRQVVFMVKQLLGLEENPAADAADAMAVALTHLHLRRRPT
ncbi:MAG: crossover junction endodeoxyribonuclease RuvC [Thermoanaerobaculales bacterium]|nr:crossover junction endodeoxyribonuclease RuvC [Thermoanaerobaculales bacterium]